MTVPLLAGRNWPAEPRTRESVLGLASIRNSFLVSGQIFWLLEQPELITETQRLDFLTCKMERMTLYADHVTGLLKRQTVDEKIL